MKQIIRKAYAKINLGLDVVRRRPDGYHEVKMIMQTISLHDELSDEGLYTLYQKINFEDYWNRFEK